MTTQPDLAAVARGVGRGFTFMLLGGLVVVALSGLLGVALTAVALTAAALVAFSAAAWDLRTAMEGGLAGGGTYLVFLPLAFFGEGDPPGITLIVPLLAGAVVVGAAVGWWRGRVQGATP